jgi:phage-related protein
VSALTSRRYLAIGYDTSGTATIATQNTVTNGAKAVAYPILTITGPSSGTLTWQFLENQTTGAICWFNLAIQAGEVVTIDFRPGRRSVVSSFRGAVVDNPLTASDFSSFYLLPGANVIAAFATGTTTAATAVMTWAPEFVSVDGVA